MCLILPLHLKDLEEGLAQVMRSDLRFQDDDNRGARRGKTRIGPHYKEVIKTEKDDKAVASRSFSPIKTSTPAKGYDEEEHQTQLLEDPIEALQTQQAANSREKVAIKPAKKQQHHERAPVIREVRKKRVSSPESDEVTQEPDKLVDLNVKLAMLLVDNHRTSLKSYKSVKSAGINSIIDIVATGCSEAEQMDINFLQR